MAEFKKEKVIWTRKMNLKLVRFIENHPNIWDPKHPEYTSLGVRDQTYQEFTALYGNKFSIRAVRERWTNIRSTFAKHLRNLLANRAKNSDEEYKDNWHLWEPCQFLMKVSRRIKPDISDVEDDGTGEETENNNDAIAETSNEHVTTTEDENTDVNTDELTNIPACNTIAENLVKVFKEVQNDSFGIDNTQNGKIGKMVTKTLSHKNSFEAASASQKIMNILLLYDSNNPINPNNLKSHDDS